MYCIMYLKLRSTKKGKALALVGLGLGAKTGVERQSENNNNNILGCKVSGIRRENPT